MADKFNYKYNAPTRNEREEINNILNDYLPKQEKESKIETLRRLDFKVKNTPMIVGLSTGIIGTLIFGLGLAFILEWNQLITGIIITSLGLIVICLAYPLYNKLYKSLKNKYKDEIIKLSNELLSIEEKLN